MAPLLTVLAIQSVIAMASYSIPVVAPAMAIDLGVAPRAVGMLVSVLYFTAMVVGLTAGGLIARHGATVVFQGLLVLIGLGILLLTLGGPVWALAGAVLIGAATGPLNPTGSHVMSRVSPPNWQPLVFSIKQCGTPGGGMLAGAILPPLIVLYDWQTALYVIPAAAVAVLVLTLITGVGPREPKRPGPGLSLGDILQSLRLVSADRVLRGHALFGMAFAGCQLAMATYLVVYLWRELALAPETAGLVFAVAHGSGVAARIVFGLIAGRWLSSRTILSLLGAVMAAGLASLALSDATWPIAAFYLTAIVIGISGNGWVGLFFSELAILAPEGRTADAAAGSQFYMYGGVVAGPLLGAAIVAATGSYAAAFATLAAIALTAGIGLYRLPK